MVKNKKKMIQKEKSGVSLMLFPYFIFVNWLQLSCTVRIRNINARSRNAFMFPSFLVIFLYWIEQ